MPTERFLHFHLDTEIDRLFNDSSIPADQRPNAVIIMGAVAAGKTTIRKQKYPSGYVLIDAAGIFLSLSLFVGPTPRHDSKSPLQNQHS
jgi:hypothetical protein